MQSGSISAAQRVKELVSISAICTIWAVGVAGAGVSHAEASQPAAALDPHAARLEASPAGHALSAIAGNFDENVREAAERSARAVSEPLVSPRRRQRRGR
jgi:hypothetical protein